MPWLNEQRTKYAKIVQNDSDPNRYRIAASVAKLHYESELDSGNFDTEVDLTPQRVNNALLNGWRITNNSWHFAYQGFAQAQNQYPQGTLAYGGRKGQHWFTMRPFRMGFIHWPTRSFDAVGGAPTFSTPTVENRQKVMGINDADPATWTVPVELRVSLGNLWTAGAGSVEWQIKATGGRLKQDFIINQAARDALTQYFQNNVATPASENWFGVAYQVDIADIPSVTDDDQAVGDDIEPTNRLRLRDAAGRFLGRIQNGEIYVPGRGGRVAVRKRFYQQGGQWYLFIGARVDQMAQNLLPGDLVIDPPISEEDITQNADDAWEGYPGTTMDLGFNGMVYTGDNGNPNAFSMGFRFQTVPIAQGATVNSATLEPRQNQATPTTEDFTIYGEDVDDAAAFTTTAADLTGRSRTATSGAFDETDYPGSGNRASWDVSSQLQTIVNRSGWVSNNDLAFLCIGATAANYDYTGWNDYSGGAANACDFNADVTTASGAQIPINRLAGVSLKHMLGR